MQTFFANANYSKSHLDIMTTLFLEQFQVVSFTIEKKELVARVPI